MVENESGLLRVVGPAEPHFENGQFFSVMFSGVSLIAGLQPQNRLDP